MKDEIFLGNLLGLLKTGKWNLNLEEANAFLQIFQETKKRHNALSLTISDKEPIKKHKEK